VNMRVRGRHPRLEQDEEDRKQAANRHRSKALVTVIVIDQPSESISQQANTSLSRSHRTKAAACSRVRAVWPAGTRIELTGTNGRV
jgi:hypothetical protein